MARNDSRFVAVRRQTDSGRTRVWYVKDTLGVFPLWQFGDHRSEKINRALAQVAAKWMNDGDRLNLARDSRDSVHPREA